MEFERIKKINKDIIKRALEEVEKDMITKSVCDLSDMKILSMAIDNVKDIHEIELMKIEEQAYHTKHHHEKERILRHKNEFDKCVEDIIEKHGEEKGIEAIMMLMSDVMEDLAILQPKIYDTVMMKLRGLK